MSLTDRSRRAFAACVVAATVFVTPVVANDTPAEPTTAPASSAAAPDLAPVRALIEAKDWAGAIAVLKPIVEKANNADAYNLYAFSLRNSGDTTQALTYYSKALDLDPDHKGAREYLGELYVKLGDMPKAKEQLAKLATLCPSGCEERADLEKAIAGAQ
jgi:tetratricopeptide (TPR) repeat protein